jgi:D-3-phosphoglycerate dehydrogenase
MIACHRHLRSAMRAALDGRWDPRPFCGRQLSGRTLGVLGMGRLGRMVAEYGKAFRMRVLGCDLKPFDLPGVERADFRELLCCSDAVSIHIHMTPDNYHLFNDRAFGTMKAGAVLVNTSRGDIIDEEALLRALESGRLVAFGADVIHDEWRSDMSESPLIRYARDHENVIVTPHIGGNTTVSLWGARVHSAVKLARCLRDLEALKGG